MHKILFLILFFSSFNSFALEMSSEATYTFKEGLNQKYKDQKLLNIGLQKIIADYLKSKKLDDEQFIKKLNDKYKDEEEFSERIKSFFTKTEVLRLSFGDAKDDNLNQTATVNADFDPARITEKYYELLLDLEELSQKNLYLTLNVDLLGNTKWDDLGVNSKTSFYSSLSTAWKENFDKKFDQFQKIIITDIEIQNKLENFFSKFNSEAFEIKYFINFKKVSENKNLNKKTFLISAHMVVLKSQTRESVMAFEFPSLKKEMSVINKKDLSSTLATISYNFLNSKITEINEKISTIKSLAEIEYLVTGNFLLSDISKVKERLGEYLKDAEYEVSIASMALGSSKLLIKMPVEKQSDFKEKLQKMDKLPLSANSSEQKFLIFDSNNNSFAIVTNN